MAEPTKEQLEEFKTKWVEHWLSLNVGFPLQVVVSYAKPGTKQPKNKNLLEKLLPLQRATDIYGKVGEEKGKNRDLITQEWGDELVDKILQNPEIKRLLATLETSVVQVVEPVLLKLKEKILAGTCNEDDYTEAKELFDRYQKFSFKEYIKEFSPPTEPDHTDRR